MKPPVMELNELRQRYEELGEILEIPGERTALGRCFDFESFLRNGYAVSLDLREGRVQPEEKRAYPGLFRLIDEAWPEE